jgi:hypothetical protein
MAEEPQADMAVVYQRRHQQTGGVVMHEATLRQVRITEGQQQELRTLLDSPTLSAWD